MSDSKQLIQNLASNEQTQPVSKLGIDTPSQQQKQTNQQNNDAQLKKVEQGIQKLDISDQKKQANMQGQTEAKNQETQKQGAINDDTKNFININRNNVAFGKGLLFPGSIQELDITIELNQNIEIGEQNDTFMLRVIAKCNNNQFDALDQYVFSVRSNQRFEYFEEVRFKIRQKQKAQVKVAVKIPPVKQNYHLEGSLEVQLQSLKPLYLPITANCQIPSIVCMKDLYKVSQDCSMIKIPAKKNQIRMPPIPFKNLSPINFSFQVQTITNQNMSNRAYDIATQNFINCQANMQFFVNLQLRENINYKGIVPARQIIRKVLVLKIKNSSIYFDYPIQVQIYEGAPGGSS